MAKQKKQYNSREYMELAIKVMNDSIQEPRDDKISPNVGAVLIKPPLARAPASASIFCSCPVCKRKREREIINESKI